MAELNIICWNVNGVRAIMKKGFPDSIKAMAPDIFCLQETKAQLEDAKTALTLMSDFPHQDINYSKARKGYSGTAIVGTVKPLNVTQDIGVEEHDMEGRVVTAEYEDFYLVCVYVPNSGSGLKRLDYRETWDVAFTNYLVELDKKKSVVVCGDFNVAHQEIDIARAKQNYNKSSGYTQKEIDGFQRLLDYGFVDTFRHFHPEEVKYSYWNQMFKSRERNVGWRIDYFLVSERILDKVKSAEIYNEHMGSDHCPVGLTIDI